MGCDTSPHHDTGATPAVALTNTRISNVHHVCAKHVVVCLGDLCRSSTHRWIEQHSNHLNAIVGAVVPIANVFGVRHVSKWVLYKERARAFPVPVYVVFALTLGRLKPLVSRAVWVAARNLSRACCNRMWRSWAFVVTRGCPGRGRSATLPVSCSLAHNRLTVERWHPRRRATSVMEIPACSMPIASSLSCVVSLGILLLHQYFCVFFVCFI